jgi:hypothetical protein
MRRSISICSCSGVSEAYMSSHTRKSLKREPGPRGAHFYPQLELQFRLSSVFPAKLQLTPKASDIKITPTLQDRPDYGLLWVRWVLAVH